jgi:UDP-glucose 4-epimerase
VGRKETQIEVSLDRWLITGGCGFIGGNLLLALLREGKARRVRILDNLSVGTRQDLEFYLAQAGTYSPKEDGNPVVYRADAGDAPAVELLIGDIRDAATCSAAARDTDVVVHLAANTGVQLSMQNPRADMESNVVGVFNVLEACREHGVRKFIFASSGAVVGETDPPIREDKVARPISPYGASKLAGEAYCLAYSRSFGVDGVALRFGNVYGPLSKNKTSVVAKYIKNAMDGRPLEIYGDGRQTRDFIYIDDLVNAILLAVRSGASGEVFQIATHRETTVSEVALEVKRLFKESTGADIEVVHGEALKGDVRRNFADISKARTVLGFEPQFDLSRGLQRTLDYFLARR